jgi:hypothetical protein
MAVASKPPVSKHKRQLPSRARAVAAVNPKGKPLATSAKGLASRPKPSGKTVPMPSSESVPWWLRSLCTLERRCSSVTILLMVTTLTVYGWTVYSQQMWSKAYRKLGTLQRDERQLTTTNEVLKNKMALQGEEQGTGLVPPNPTTTIFLTPASGRPAAAANSVVPNTKPSVQQPTPLSLGY